MKILIDASIISIGGGVQVALSLIENIVLDPNFKVICVVSDRIDEQLSPSIKLKIQHYYVEKSVPIYGKFVQGNRLSLIEENHKPDFVFVVFGPAYWKPKAKTLQGFALGKMLYQQELKIGFFEFFLNFIKSRIFKWSKSYLVVETELVKLKLVSYLNYSRDDIFVIGNSYSPNFKKCIMENKNNILPSDADFQILVPGSYYPHKNLEKIIFALKELKKSFKEYSKKINFLFTIPKQSEGWNKLVLLAKQHNVENFIGTTGFIENSKFGELYLKSNAIICASLVESSTAVFPEAFLAGRPLLVSDRPFSKELCENAALYFDPLDEKNIADVIWKLVNDVSLQVSLTANGQKILLKNYPSAEKKWALQKNLIFKLVNK